MQHRTILVTALYVISISTITWVGGAEINLDYLLADSITPPVSASGTNTLCLPYDPDTALNVASDLRNSIGASAVDCILRFDRTNDVLIKFPCTPPPGAPV